MNPLFFFSTSNIKRNSFFSHSIYEAFVGLKTTEAEFTPATSFRFDLLWSYKKSHVLPDTTLLAEQLY